MTVGELKQQLMQFDDSLEIGGSGHFGELLEIYSVSLDERKNEFTVQYKTDGGSLVGAILYNKAIVETETPVGPCVRISMESAGREPD
jgi:hypothetical protein